MLLGAMQHSFSYPGHASRQPTSIRGAPMQQLTRRRFMKASSTAAAGIAIASPAIAQSMPEVRWRLAASWPKSLDVPFGACETLAKYIAEATDNKFQIQLFAAGEIVPALQVLDAVQNGSVENVPHRHLLLHRERSNVGALLRSALQ